MDIIRLYISNPLAAAASTTFLDTFSRPNGAIGPNYVTPPDDQLAEFTSGNDFLIESGAVVGIRDEDAGPPDEITVARLLRAIPGDQRIELVVTIPEDMVSYVHVSLMAHMNGEDARGRTAYWEIDPTYGPHWPVVFNQDHLGVRGDTVSHHTSSPPAQVTYTFRFDSYINGNWEASIDGVTRDLGENDFLPFEPGDYVGFAIWWNADGFGDSPAPRIESFMAKSIGNGGGLEFSGSAIINGLTSKTWVERYAEPGEFKVVGTLTGNDVELFQGDAFDGLPLGALVSHLNTYEVMIVENREIEINDQGDPQITVSGRSLETVLDERTVGSNRRWPYATSPPPDFGIPGGRLGPQIMYMLNWHLGTGTYALLDPRDKFPNLKPIDQTVSPTISAARYIKRGSLYERTRELLALGGFGIKLIRPNPNSAYPNDIVMSVHSGIDRRNTVEFTSAGGDLETVTYLFSTRTLKNAAQVTGRWLETMVKGPESGYNRRVMYVDGSDIDRSQETAPTGATRTTLLNRMSARGRQALASQKGVSITNAELSSEPPFLYRVHYNVGDLVTIHGDFDVRATKRVTEYTETEDEMGDSSYPTFGDV